MRCTVVHPSTLAHSNTVPWLILSAVKVADLEALADAVRAENHRVYALEAQARYRILNLTRLRCLIAGMFRGQQPFVGLNQHPQSYFELNKEGINWERVASKVSHRGPFHPIKFHLYVNRSRPQGFTPSNGPQKSAESGGWETDIPRLTMEFGLPQILRVSKNWWEKPKKARSIGLTLPPN